MPIQFPHRANGHQPPAGQPAQSGIIFSPTSTGKSYLCSNHHRGGGPQAHKSAWLISHQAEFLLFCDADYANWVDANGDYWGIAPDCGVIGTRGQRLAKFPSNATPQLPWHGFPVSPQADENHAPPDDFVDVWIDNAVVPKEFGRKIQRCRI